MAKLSDFITDMKTVADGDWIRVDEAEFGDLEIHARGISDESIDAQRVMETKLIKKYGSRENIPNAVTRQMNAQILERYLIDGVRNLVHDDGTEVTLQEFHQFLHDPAYSRLGNAAWKAVNQVSIQNASELEDAVGNSRKRSKSNANGELHAPN